MVNAGQVKEIVAQFKQRAEELSTEVREKADVHFIINNNDVDLVRDMVRSIQNIMIGSIPTGFKIPKIVLHTSSFGEEKVAYIKLKVINSLHSDKKFSFGTTVTTDDEERIYDHIYDFLYEVYEKLLIDDIATQNLIKVNDVLNQAVASSSIDYGIRIVTSLGNEGKKVAYIADDEVVFVADYDRIFSLDDIIVFLDEPTEEISNDVIQDHFQAIVDELSLAQTPVQLVNAQGGVLVSYVCDINKRVKPMTIIKKVCNKNVRKLNTSKDVIAYYNEDNVYALLSCKEGVFEVILSPFDTKTLCKVDVDVIKKIS